MKVQVECNEDNIMEYTENEVSVFLVCVFKTVRFRWFIEDINSLCPWHYRKTKILEDNPADTYSTATVYERVVTLLNSDCCEKRVPTSNPTWPQSLYNLTLL